MTLVPDGRRCACGNRGCWEMYASGPGAGPRRPRAGRRVAGGRRAAARAGRRRRRRPRRAGGHRRRGRGRPGRAVDLHRRWGAGSAAGWPTWPRCSTRRCSSSAAGVSAAGELLLRPAREEFAHTLTGRGFRPVASVVGAPRSGPDAGLVGRGRPGPRSRRSGQDRQRADLRVLSYNVRSMRDDRGALARVIQLGRAGRGVRAGGAAVPAVALDVRGAGPDQRPGRRRRRPPGRRRT